MKSRVLFILRKRAKPIFGVSDCNGGYGYTSSPGLKNSAKLVAEMLTTYGIESEVVDVVDNNGIDRVVTEFKPTHVMIEALWVIPEKFEVLKKLHPDVIWIVRVHSNLPFIAGEGIAIDWLYKYMEHGVYVAFNTVAMLHVFADLLCDDLVLYLPNYYPPVMRSDDWVYPEDDIHVGCFGAVRPLKNQLTQAIAAVQYAKEVKKRLYFHINGTRIEGGGDAVLKNIVNLFNNLPGDQFILIQHPWYDRDEFIAHLSAIDLLLQVSFSETFNIVAADAVSKGIPIVVSKEIKWAHPLFYANPTDVDNIVSKMKLALFIKKITSRMPRYLVDLNWWGLREYSDKSINWWLSVIEE